MKYFKSGGSTFIDNGKNRLRVALVLHKPSPFFPERTVKVLRVEAVISQSGAQPPPPIGSHLAMSFPNDKLNGAEYEWMKNNEAEEMFVPFTFDEGKARARRNILATGPGRN